MLNTETLTEHTVKACMTSYDEKVLHTLPGGDNGPASYNPDGSDSDVLLTWVDGSGLVLTGKARVLRQFKSLPHCRPYVEASPCPGAWAMIWLDNILSVRRISTL